MSVNITVHIPTVSRKSIHDQVLYREALHVDQDYNFMSKILDMTNRSTVVSPPVVNAALISPSRLPYYVFKHPEYLEEDLYICKAREFKKLRTRGLNRRNRAILLFLQAFKPGAEIVLSVSW